MILIYEKSFFEITNDNNLLFKYIDYIKECITSLGLYTRYILSLYIIHIQCVTYSMYYLYDILAILTIVLIP